MNILPLSHIICRHGLSFHCKWHTTIHTHETHRHSSTINLFAWNNDLMTCNLKLNQGLSSLLPQTPFTKSLTLNCPSLVSSHPLLLQSWCHFRLHPLLWYAHQTHYQNSHFPPWEHLNTPPFTFPLWYWDSYPCFYYIQTWLLQFPSFWPTYVGLERLQCVKM